MSSDFNIRVGAIVDTRDIDKELQNYSKKSSSEVIVKIKGEVTGRKETDQYINSVGELVTRTKEFDLAETQLSDTITKVSQKYKTASKNVEDLGNKTNTANRSIKETTGNVGFFGQSLENITKKVIGFGLATEVVQQVSMAFRQAIEEVALFDEAITELKKVTDLGGEGLELYKNKAYELARDLSTSVTEVTNAVTEFSKAGFSLEESMKLSKSSVMFQTIADGAVTASDSAKLLTQVIKGYNMEVGDSEKIISAINEVSNNYSVSSTDLNMIGHTYRQCA